MIRLRIVHDLRLAIALCARASISSVLLHRELIRPTAFVRTLTPPHYVSCAPRCSAHRITGLLNFNGRIFLLIMPAMIYD